MKRFYNKHKGAIVVLQFVAILEAFGRLERNNDYKAVLFVSPILIYWVIRIIKEDIINK